VVYRTWLRAWLGALAVALAMALSGAFGLGAQPAAAATVSDCTTSGTTSLQGGEYIYQQNEWNSTATQCASIDDSTGAWSISQANFGLGTSGAPATYPSSYKGCHWGVCSSNSGLPIQVSALGSATTSWSTVQPASGAYDVAYDIWFNSTPTTKGQPDGTEMMIWLNSRGGVQPFGSQTGTASLDGMAWNVWTGQQSSPTTGWKIISYVLQGGGTSFSNLDVKALINDAVSRGSLNPAHYLIDAEAGFEIWQGGQGLGTTAYSFSASPTGSSGGGDTTPPSTPTGVTVTGTTSSSVSLSWTASTDNVGVAGYRIYRGGTQIGTSTTTSYTDTGLTAATQYTYTIAAYDAAGNLSPTSTAVNATTASGSSGGGGSGTVKVQYKNNDTNTTDNQIKPGLQLVNTGSSPLNLSTVTIRYWFTSDGGATTFTTNCDYAALGCGNLTQKVTPMTTPATGADHYLEVGFTSGAGSLAAGASSGDIQNRLNKTDWSAFNQADDYSYATNTAHQDDTKVTVYVNGTLVWGTEP
jgi:chitodextrinase